MWVVYCTAMIDDWVDEIIIVATLDYSFSNVHTSFVIFFTIVLQTHTGDNRYSTSQVPSHSLPIKPLISRVPWRWCVQKKMHGCTIVVIDTVPRVGRQVVIRMVQEVVSWWRANRRSWFFKCRKRRRSVELKRELESCCFACIWIWIEFSESFRKRR